MKNPDSDITSLLQNLYNENAEEVRQAIKEIGRVGKGSCEAMKALQEFLGKERRTPLRVLAAQTIAKIKQSPPPFPAEFKKPNIFQCPGAEKIKRIEIIDITCPYCHKKGTASAAGFENEFACESCGKMIQREVPESCIEKCPVGSECVGEDRYQKYLKGRKKGS
ncbi:MAG: hypothetical protein MRJ65_04315 [Candidatus Brocadiaceae bacterium]|nr:hypothetical protein [Candidatus Brocadiaceae bacterium]